MYLIVGLFAGGLALLFGRDFIRGRISGGNDSIGDIRDSIGEAGKINKQSGDTIKSAQESTGNIKQDNSDARNGIRTAREILKRAKKRPCNKTG